MRELDPLAFMLPGDLERAAPPRKSPDRTWGFTGLWLAGNEGMEKKAENYCNGFRV